jgi:peptide chain release factor 1
MSANAYPIFNAIMKSRACQASIDEALEQAKQALVPPDSVDAASAIIEIRAGTGGREAALFASDLCKMYQK